MRPTPPTNPTGCHWLAGLCVLALLAAAAPTNAADPPAARPPNIIFILADDLGYAELGCYGQTKIRTSHIDALAAEGMRFTQYYAGSPVCAPSRCTLLTGLHTGHAYIRDNRELKTEGQTPIPADTVTLPKLLQQAGYHTGGFGKWGLGSPGSTGEPNAQGFDRWFGYNCQRQAHSYYPAHLWRDREKVMLEGNANGKRGQYSHDLIADEALKFIRASATDPTGRPFFAYLPFTVPHAALQVPEDSLAEYAGKFDETPYDGRKGYTPHPTPRAAYAAMVTRMDRSVGQVMALLTELKIDERTLVLFSSDNGPTYNGGTDSAFFQSAGPFRGLKGSVYEGGIRVPLIARWPGRIKAGATSEHACAAWDVLPTLLEMAGAKPPTGAIDGISFAPTLLGAGEQKPHEYLYWEYHSAGGLQAVRMGDWKGVRLGVRKDRNGPIALYDLKTDVGETRNVAADHPDIVKRIESILATARTETELWHWGSPPK